MSSAHSYWVSDSKNFVEELIPFTPGSLYTEEKSIAISVLFNKICVPCTVIDANINYNIDCNDNVMNDYNGNFIMVMRYHNCNCDYNYNYDYNYNHKYNHYDYNFNYNDNKMIVIIIKTTITSIIIIIIIIMMMMKIIIFIFSDRSYLVDSKKTHTDIYDCLWVCVER